MPKYLNILLTDTLRSKIREIRIEGHSNDVPYPKIDPDPYMANLILSQRRALSIMYFIRELPQYKAFSDEDKRLLEYWFTATGFSYGHAIDEDNNAALLSDKPIDKMKSRRVELRIITSGEEVLENFIGKTQPTTQIKEEEK